MKAIWMKKGIMTLMAAAVTMSPEQTVSLTTGNMKPVRILQ